VGMVEPVVKSGSCSRSLLVDYFNSGAFPWSYPDGLRDANVVSGNSGAEGYRIGVGFDLANSARTYNMGT